MSVSHLYALSRIRLNLRGHHHSELTVDTSASKVFDEWRNTFANSAPPDASVGLCGPARDEPVVARCG